MKRPARRKARRPGANADPAASWRGQRRVACEEVLRTRDVIGATGRAGIQRRNEGRRLCIARVVNEGGAAGGIEQSKIVGGSDGALLADPDARRAVAAGGGVAEDVQVDLLVEIGGVGGVDA